MKEKDSVQCMGSMGQKCRAMKRARALLSSSPAWVGGVTCGFGSVAHHVVGSEQFGWVAHHAWVRFGCASCGFGSSGSVHVWVRFGCVSHGGFGVVLLGCASCGFGSSSSVGFGTITGDTQATQTPTAAAPAQPCLRRVGSSHSGSGGTVATACNDAAKKKTCARERAAVLLAGQQPCCSLGRKRARLTAEAHSSSSSARRACLRCTPSCVFGSGCQAEASWPAATAACFCLPWPACFWLNTSGPC